MEQITTSGSTAGNIEQKTNQFSLIIQTLVLTGILSLTAKLTLPTTKVALSKPPLPQHSLLKSVTNAVLQDVSQDSGLPVSKFRIVATEQQTWSDDCLGVNSLGILCTEMRVPGWQVTVASEQTRWVYRTNASGSVVKLAQGVDSLVQKSPK